MASDNVFVNILDGIFGGNNTEYCVKCKKRNSA